MYRVKSSTPKKPQGIPAPMRDSFTRWGGLNKTETRLVLPSSSGCIWISAAPFRNRLPRIQASMEDRPFVWSVLMVSRPSLYGCQMTSSVCRRMWRIPLDTGSVSGACLTDARARFNGRWSADMNCTSLRTILVLSCSLSVGRLAVIPRCSFQIKATWFDHLTKLFNFPLKEMAFLSSTWRRLPYDPCLDAFDFSLETGGSVGESKLHTYTLERFYVADKHGLTSVLLAYIHLTVTQIHEEHPELLRFTECVDTLIHSGQRIRIFDCPCFKVPVIDTEAYLTILLR